MTKEVYVSKKSRGDAPGSQDLASPVGHGFCSEVSVPMLAGAVALALPGHKAYSWDGCAVDALPPAFPASSLSLLRVVFPSVPGSQRGPRVSLTQPVFHVSVNSPPPPPSQAAEPQDQVGSLHL